MSATAELYPHSLGSWQRRIPRMGILWRTKSYHTPIIVSRATDFERISSKVVGLQVERPAKTKVKTQPGWNLGESWPPTRSPPFSASIIPHLTSIVISISGILQSVSLEYHAYHGSSQILKPEILHRPREVGTKSRPVCSSFTRLDDEIDSNSKDGIPRRTEA